MRSARRCSGARQGWSEHAANERSWREAYVGAAQGPIATLEEIKRSNLRGRGGAGFTTGVKWEACRHATGLTRYVVCNADEGEPGTFKDRVLLTQPCRPGVRGHDGRGLCDRRQPGLPLPARRIPLPARAARGDARSGAARPTCSATASAASRASTSTSSIHVGAGSYVCGEESALIESLEGKRGVPRNRPPYPVTHGYLQQPTIVNNVETLCAAALIAVHGGDWYRALGTLEVVRHQDPLGRRATSRAPASTSTRSA